MIREEVEKLRGYSFTEEEMKEIIIPAFSSSEIWQSKNNREDEERPRIALSEEKMKALPKPSFVSVKAIDGYDRCGFYEVPTTEEYNDFRRRMSIIYGMLDERIAKLEANEVFTDKVTVLIQIDRKDPNSSKGFDVIIDDGDEEKKYTISELDLRRQGVVYEGIYKIDYIGKHKFILNDLKITCKYPVILRCYDCQVSKYIEPTIKE